MAQQQLYPKNPPRARITNIPRELGHTCTQGGRLEYEDPIDSTWSKSLHLDAPDGGHLHLIEPAVRLETLRPRLIQEAPPSLYTHAKEKGYDATDVTTFLAKDQPYGSDRQHRDPLLFQITSTDSRGQKPTGYLKDGELIVLDAFNHGIRDFPMVLPKCLSTNIGGYDIMNYFRQNQHITLYDLIARMPNGYHEKNAQGLVVWHEGPPRYGTVGMRATRFRMHAGLLSWKRRSGSDAKNAKILSLIPANCKDPLVNSTASHRDFTEAEQKEVMKVLVGTAPNRSRNANKNDTRVEEQENDGYEEDSEVTIEDVEVAEDEPRTSLPGLQGQNAGSAHIEANGDYNPPARKAYKASYPPWNSGYETSDEEQSPTPKAKHRRSKVTPSNETSQPYPFCSHKPNGPPLPALGSFANPILLKGKSDRKSQDNISKTSVSASESDEPRPKRQRATSPIPMDTPTKSPPLDDLDGPTEIVVDTEQTDYRTIPPPTDKDRNAIQQALNLTREDFRQKTNMNAPPLLAIKFREESYDAQRQRLQDLFSRVWVGTGAVPQLYCLPAWYGGFREWRIQDEKGMVLYSNVLK